VKQPYVLTVNKRQPLRLTSKLIMLKTWLAPSHLRVGSDLVLGGNKGERYYRWARIELSYRQPEGFNRWFLFRRCPNIPMTHVLLATIRFRSQRHSLETMVGVAGQRWRIEVFSIYQRPTWQGITKFAHGQVGIATSLWSWRRSFLVCAALSAESLGELSTPPFFFSRRGWLCALGAVRGLSSGSVP